MPIDGREALDPAVIAVLGIEGREGIIGPRSPFADLVESIRERAMHQMLGGLLARARAAGLRLDPRPLENQSDEGPADEHALGARMLGRSRSVSATVVATAEVEVLWHAQDRTHSDG
jgi:hypothetical protein